MIVYFVVWGFVVFRFFKLFKDLNQKRRWLTDSKSLFCLQQQKSNQKNAAPLIKLS